MINEFRPMNHLTSLQNFICTIGNLPTSYVLSLSYEEQIWCLCDFLENKVFLLLKKIQILLKKLSKRLLSYNNMLLIILII